MMKKLTSLLLSAALLVGMLACGASAKTNTTIRVAGLKGPTTIGSGESAGHGKERNGFPELRPAALWCRR